MSDDDQLRDRAVAMEGEVLREGEGQAPAGESQRPELSTGDVLTALLRPTFDILAPAWAVSDVECAMLGHAYGDVLDKYFPEFDWGVELAALLATAAVFGPRMRRPRHYAPPPPAADETPAG